MTLLWKLFMAKAILVILYTLFLSNKPLGCINNTVGLTQTVDIAFWHVDSWLHYMLNGGQNKIIGCGKEKKIAGCKVWHQTKFCIYQGSELYTVVTAETQKKKLSFWAPHCGFHLQECLSWHADKAYSAKPKTRALQETKADISLRARAADLVVLTSTWQLDIPAIFRIKYRLFTIAVHLRLNCLLSLSLYSFPPSKGWNKKAIEHIYPSFNKMRGEQFVHVTRFTGHHSAT